MQNKDSDCTTTLICIFLISEMKDSSDVLGSQKEVLTSKPQLSHAAGPILCLSESVITAAKNGEPEQRVHIQSEALLPKHCEWRLEKGVLISLRQTHSLLSRQRMERTDK